MADLPALKTVDDHPSAEYSRGGTNVPLALTSLVGRERELTTFEQRLLDPTVRLLTLTGAGGIGKTRLALAVSERFEAAFADGVWFVNLAPIRDPALVLPTITNVLNVKEYGTASLLELLTSYLREKQILLVLDNFEQVLDAANLITSLLAAAPNLKVMVTSREVLHLSGEHVVVVPPLALPDPRHLPELMELTQYDAVQLFIQRAQAARADFTVTHAIAPAVAELCVRLEGIPLAIELAAARTTLLPPPALLARLRPDGTRRLKLLTGGARDLPERQRTLRNTLDWSFDLLTPSEQTLFTRLAVFVGGRTLESAEAVCNAEGDLEIDVLDGLQSLLDKSLLRQEAGVGDEPRFAMLETVWEYAKERLEQSGQVHRLRQHYAIYYLQLAETAAAFLIGPEQEFWLERLEAEHADLRATLRWLLEQRERELTLRLAGALFRFWLMRGYLIEGHEWLEGALTIKPDDVETAPCAASERVARATALNGAGNLARALGDYSTARVRHEESLALRRNLGDKRGIAASLDNLGTVAFEQRNYTSARTLYQESLALRREENDTWGIATSLNSLGNMAYELQDYRSARSLYQESLALHQKLGDTQSIAMLLSNLGMVANEQRDYTSAHTLYQKSLAIYQDLGDIQNITDTLEGLAGVAAGQGQAARALRMAGATHALRAVLHVPLPPSDQDVFDRWLAPALAALGPDQSAAALAAGQAMTLEQAIADALADEYAEPDDGAEVEALQQQPQDAPTRMPGTSPWPAGLTTREVEVLRLAANGLSVKEIAARLIVTPRTVRAHLGSIYSKLDVNSRAAATRFAIEHGLA